MYKIKGLFKRITGAKHFQRYFIASVVVIMGVVIFAVSALQSTEPPPDDPLIAEATPNPNPSNGEVATPTPTPTPAPTPTADPWPPDMIRGIFNPLTGEPTEEDISRNRPFAFVLNNMTVALPQVGISHVDILYEFPVEGGITRMVAFIQDLSELDTLGSIRSARYYFVSIAESFDAIFAHAGHSYVARDHMSNRNINNLDGVSGAHARLFHRDPERRRTMGFEHSMVALGQRIYEAIPNFNFRTEHEEGFESSLRFSDNAAPVNGGSARNVTARITSSKNSLFTYYEEYGQYFMRQFNRDFVDGETGERVGFTNILLIQTSVTARPGDAAGLRMIETTGSGTGYFINGGYYTEIRWSRANESAQFEYTLPDGSPLLLGVGRTFVGVVPQELDHTFE